MTDLHRVQLLLQIEPCCFQDTDSIKRTIQFILNRTQKLSSSLIWIQSHLSTEIVQQLSTSFQQVQNEYGFPDLPKDEESLCKVFVLMLNKSSNTPNFR